MKDSEIFSKLEDNLNELTSKFGNSPDLIIRKFEIIHTKFQVAAVYMEGITDKGMVDDFISHLMTFDTVKEGLLNVTSEQEIFTFMKDKALSIGKETIVHKWNELCGELLSGNTIVFIDGIGEAVSGSTSGGEVRAITEATTQVTIRGPKESFTESIVTNISLVRRRIKSVDLWVEQIKVGAVTQTEVAIMYINGIADNKSVQKIKTRLKNIKIDAILESGYIEQFIEDSTFSPFPTVYNTERPDSVAGNLLEGRIAIFVNGTPFVLIVPTTFFMFFHAVEDYYQRFEIATLVRMLRFTCLLISLFGPAMFIAALTFHQEMIPTPLLINLASQREGVPFPIFVEAIIMEVTFEIIREAGIRMPSSIGQTVSIIGGLVLGQAAVEAGIVSPAMVILVSITGISSFATPAFNMALSIRYLRFVILFVSAFMGLYGIAVAGIILIAHMCGLQSMGIPFMAPVAPFTPADQKDIIIRLPLQSMRSRPRFVSSKDKKRMETDEENRGDLNEG